MKSHHSASQAALAVLVVLQLTMLGALYTQTAPHPPLTVPIFALGPFIGTALSVAIAAWIVGGTSNNNGALLSGLAALLALVSFGPQKWVDPTIGQIWPAVALGQVAAIVLIVQSVRRGWSNTLSK